MSDSVIIVGAGAAGLTAAGFASRAGKNVLLLERNERPARKLMITGKGRCNLTNACTLVNELIDNVPDNGRFLYSAFSRFMPGDVMEMFEELGVSLKIERGNRVFPESDKAVDIVDALVKFASLKGVRRRRARVSLLLISDGCVKGVCDEDGNIYNAESVIIATGGLSYPLTGSTGDGYALASSAGHRIVPARASLVPLVSDDDMCKRLQGVSLRNVAIEIYDKTSYSTVYKDFGEMLFTHFGVSGPVILSASSHMKDERDRYELTIDLKPALSHEQLDARVLRDFAKYANKGIANGLSELLPHALIPEIIRLSEIAPDERVNQITKAQRGELVSILKCLPVEINGFRPIDEAIVTAGGVATDEINPKTMESKIVKGLYFAGEVIDVSAYTGGFNLQIAFSTGALAGNSV